MTEKVPIGIELSTLGLEVVNGVITEDDLEELTWPESNATYTKMGYDPVISSANTTIKSFIRNLEYHVKVDSEEVSEEQRNMIRFIESCMKDMDHSFSDCINEALSMLDYGYSLHEKVFKYRNQKGKFKSKHNDPYLSCKIL